jgi:hypothetical protein
VDLPQVFLLSPASCYAQRAALLFNERAQFFLARRVREEGSTLGEVFSFLSGLYFRGKLTYARAFANAGMNQSTVARLARPAVPSSSAAWADKPSVAPDGGIRVITTSRGLVDPETIVRLEDLREFAGVPIDAKEPRYRDPLARDAAALAARLSARARVVLLGSIASDKYVQILHAAFGERLVFPAAFVGRGDMSHGGLLLRAVDEGRELEYLPIAGSLRRGSRPGKLPPRAAAKVERQRDGGIERRSDAKQRAKDK